MKDIGFKEGLAKKKARYFVLTLILVIGLIITGLSALPLKKEHVLSLATCVMGDIVYPHSNDTRDLKEFEIETNNRVFIEIKDVYTGTRKSSETGLHYYFYKESKPSKKRYEGWVGENDRTDEDIVEITEPGVWFLVLENPSDEALHAHGDIVFHEYIDKPILDELYMWIGILVVIVSAIFFYRLYRNEKTSKKSHSKKH